MLNQLLVHQVRRRLESLSLPVAVELWDGRRLGQDALAAVRVRLHRLSSLKTFARPSLGALARAYVQGDLDLEGEARDILALGGRLCNTRGVPTKTGPGPARWWRHTRLRDRRNIEYHYDVSNDFYGLWLDPRRVYSCAYFETPDTTLEAAQVAKLDHICRKLNLQPGERLLDIGCGWGGLVMHAAQHYGVEAVGITLSNDQLEYATREIRAAGLDRQITIRRMDYRDLEAAESFDKIASVGMFEHVGRANLQRYFSTISRLLKPGGLVLNHGITAARPGAVGLGSGIAEFINDYVFPGGELVHVSEVLCAASLSGLECLDAENLRPHYGRTLWHWVQRLEARAEEARRLIGEQKYRIWRIYMAGSAHAFEHGWMELWQVLAGKSVDGRQSAYPFHRHYMYAPRQLR